jgi:hypothetical protein
MAAPESRDRGVVTVVPAGLFCAIRRDREGKGNSTDTRSSGAGLAVISVVPIASLSAAL